MKLRKGSGRSRAALLAALVVAAIAFWIAAPHVQLAAGPFTEAQASAAQTACTQNCAMPILSQASATVVVPPSPLRR